MKDNYTKDKQILRQNLGLAKDITEELEQWHKHTHAQTAAENTQTKQKQNNAAQTVKIQKTTAPDSPQNSQYNQFLIFL